MAVFRVERNRGYTVMSNHHLRNRDLTLKAKGLLSQMLSLPDNWDYTLAGLSHINRESIDAIRTAVWELEKAGYILRRQGRDEKGKMTAIEYTIYEQPQPKWLVDDAAAEVVRRIYHLCLEGKGPEQIARFLQKEQVFTPTAYYHSIGSSSANRPMPSDPYLWKDSTIDAILSNRKYTGCMVNLKTTTVSYKVHKLIRKPEEEWSIVPNAQEAIIDENTWLRVQELRKNKRRPTATGKTSLFSGLVFCADCGSKLHFCAAKSLKANQEFFRCANYKSGRGECTIHYIRNVVLEQIVSVAVSDLADFVTCHESFFLQMIGKQQSAGKDQNIRSVKSDIAAEKHRVDEIDRLIAKLYEDNFAGKLSDERYSRMAAKYEKEQAELLQSVSTKEKELAELERESVDIRLLLAGLREYSSIETLTAEVVNKIIKRIEVHNSEMVNGHKRVGIDIHFTGVGLAGRAAIRRRLLSQNRQGRDPPQKEKRPQPP